MARLLPFKEDGMKVEITNIHVGTRMRVDYGDIDDLANSLSRLGQLQPIILDGDGDLVAGERRLKAAMMLGWNEIDAIYMRDLDEVGRKEVELEENLRRKEFTWPEEVLALEKLYNLKVEKYGSRTSGTDGSEGFGIKDAADQFDRSSGNISESLQLARALREFPNLAFEKTKSAAFKQWKRLREHRIREEQAKRRNAAVAASSASDEGATLDSLVGTTGGLKAVAGPVEAPPAGTTAQVAPLVKKAGFKGYGLMYRGDSEFVLRNMDPAIIDCIVTDPPYALSMFRGDDQATSGRRLAEHQGGMYDDDPHKVLDKLDKVVEQCARVLKPNGHMYIFFHHNWYDEIREMLMRHFGEDAVEATPIIWIKNTSGIGDPNERWVYSYEPFIFINRGRSLVKPQGHNWIQTNTVPPGQKTHPTEKPTMLLRQIIQASCVKGEIVLDPYAGSGSTVIAALESGCKFYGIELDDVYYQRVVDRIALTIGTLEQQGAPQVDDSSTA
jgi:ParB/RepB/Spo0J family partition protein